MVNLEKIHYCSRKLVIDRFLLVVLLVPLVIFIAELANITSTRIQYTNAAVNESDKPGNVVNSNWHLHQKHKDNEQGDVTTIS